MAVPEISKKILLFSDALPEFEFIGFFSEVARSLEEKGFEVIHAVSDPCTRLLAGCCGLKVDYLDFNRPLKGSRRIGPFSREELQGIYSFQKGLDLADEAQAEKLNQRTCRVANFLDNYLVQNHIGLVATFHGYPPVQKIVKYLANKRNIPVLNFENGYFSNSIQVGQTGVNANNDWLTRRDPDEFWESIQAQMVRGYNPISFSFRRNYLIKSVLFLAAIWFKTPWFHRSRPEMMVRLDLRETVWRKIYFWSRHWQDRLFPDHSNASLPQRYYFVPFQVHDDSQIVFHSPWIRAMDQFLEIVYKNVRKYDPTASLVIKEHPMDIGRRNYCRLKQKYPGVIFVGPRPVEDLIEKSTAVITINSTVGFEAVRQLKPVITFGEAFYNVPGVVRHATDENDFADILQRLPREPADRVLIGTYLAELEKRFIPCVWRRRDPIGVRNVANFLAAFFISGKSEKTPGVAAHVHHA